MYNRNKRSLAVDLKAPRGAALVRRLVDNADVVIENFRPGAMDKLGFGYDALAEGNPRLIYLSLKGFLPGPYEHRTALDEVTQMMGGLAYMTGPPGTPLRAGTSVVDITGGMFGVIAVLAALNERRSTGRGQRVTSALFETTAFLVGQHMAQQAALGEEPAPMSVRRSAWGVYDLFDCAGGEKLFVAVVSDTQWREFCGFFQLDELAADSELATNAGRVEHRDRVMPALRGLFGRMTRREAAAKLERAGLPFANVAKPSGPLRRPPPVPRRTRRSPACRGRPGGNSGASAQAAPRHGWSTVERAGRSAAYGPSTLGMPPSNLDATRSSWTNCSKTAFSSRASGKRTDVRLSRDQRANPRTASGSSPAMRPPQPP